MDRAASHPDLLIVAPRQRLHSSPLEVWVVRARTTDGSVRFEQCVATNGEAVLLATLESPTGTAYGIEEWIAGLRLAPKR
ncbi:MAG: hypothetical protein LUO89_03035 [Methanothrix sp.]|nr:hypothetical protein [Methanothrix sp.]